MRWRSPGSISWSGVLFFYGGKEKILDGIGAPAGIEKQFAGTFLDTIPGLSGMALSIVTFSILAIGENVTGEHEGVEGLFLYAGATAVLFFLALQMPPYEAGNWISGRGGS